MGPELLTAHNAHFVALSVLDWACHTALGHSPQLVPGLQELVAGRLEYSTTLLVLNGEVVDYVNTMCPATNTTICEVVWGQLVAHRV